MFAAPGAARIETIRDAGGSLADIAELVKQGRYKTGAASEMAERARHRLRSAEWSAEEQYWNLACESLQDAGEFALKALIAANGSPAGYGRNLAALWRRAAALGEAISPQPDEDGLTALTECAAEGAGKRRRRGRRRSVPPHARNDDCIRGTSRKAGEGADGAWPLKAGPEKKSSWVKYPPEHASVLLHRAMRSLEESVLEPRRRGRSESTGRPVSY